MSSSAARRGGIDAGVDAIKNQLKTMPSRPGVYRMLSDKGSVLYVGKAKNLKKRVVSYTQLSRLPNRIQRMVAQTRAMEVVVTRTESEALLLEASLIQRFMPPFNILFRDDKSYPYILVTRDHDFPQLLKHRGAQKRKGWYFGPFASAGSVDETITLMQRAFMLRNCSNSFFESRERPCLQYHIKRCTAPCVGRATKESYALQVEEACDFLRGKSRKVQENLVAVMQRASDLQDYERAAVLRDRIKVLTAMQARQDIYRAGLGDADVIAAHQEGERTAIQVFFFRADRNYGTRSYFMSHAKQNPVAEVMGSFIAQFYADKPVPPRLLLSHAPQDARLLNAALEAMAGHKVSFSVPKHGEKRRLVDHARRNAKSALGRKMAESEEQKNLLKRMSETFGLPEPPERIEVYDNSHIQGGFPVGAMIAAGPEGFLKKTYRKFNIHEAKGNDDVAMMRETLMRRFRRLIDEDPERHTGMWPDVLLIDGGQGQLNKAVQVLEELGITDVAVIAMAKGPDRDAGRERFFTPARPPMRLPEGDPVLYFLQRLRDEAHRFAIGAHRTRRVQAIGQTVLEDVPGVGKSRKRALLHYFGSAKAVAGAGEDELRRAPGISVSMAKKIYDYFHGGE